MYSYLDQLSTQELEDLLQKDMETADGGDPDISFLPSSKALRAKCCSQAPYTLFY